MKTIIPFLARPTAFVIALYLVVSACGFNEDELSTPAISGKGSEITVARQTETFTGIALDMDADVYVQPGAVAKVEVEAQDNLLPYVLTYVSGNKLVIETKNNLRPAGKIKVFVTLPVLNKAVVTGAGRIIGNGTFISDEFTATVKGAGRIDLAVEAQAIKNELNGSGSIFLAGSAQKYNATITGSGDIDTSNLTTAAEVKVATSQSGASKGFKVN